MSKLVRAGITLNDYIITNAINRQFFFVIFILY